MVAESHTVVDLLAYCREYEDLIYVRAKNADGKWDSIALCDLSHREWAEWVVRWAEEGHWPYRLLTDEERAERTAQENSHAPDET